jgi:hypothetical protein
MTTRLDGNKELESMTALRETEAEIERTRERLTASLGALREELSDLADWRAWVERRPLPFLAGAFAAGFLLGWSTARGR